MMTILRWLSSVQIRSSLTGPAYMLSLLALQPLQELPSSSFWSLLSSFLLKGKVRNNVRECMFVYVYGVCLRASEGEREFLIWDYVLFVTIYLVFKKRNICTKNAFCLWYEIVLMKNNSVYVNIFCSWNKISCLENIFRL